MSLLLDHIIRHDFATVRSGICRDKKTGHAYRFSQNKIEMKMNFAIILPLTDKDKDLVKISDADCIIFDLPYGSKISVNTSLYDMTFYDIIKIDEQ